MKHLLTILLALYAGGAFAQLETRAIRRTNDVLQTQTRDQIDWYQGETVNYDLWTRSGTAAVFIPTNTTVFWFVTDSTLTNYYVFNTGTVVNATNGHIRFQLGSVNSALDDDETYESAVVVYDGSPTGQPPRLVADRTQVKVRWSPSYNGIYVGPQEVTNSYPLDASTPVLSTFWTANADGISQALGIDDATGLQVRISAAEAEIAALEAGLPAEALLRSAADAALTTAVQQVATDLSGEISAREDADTDEATARSDADIALQQDIDALGTSVYTKVESDLRFAGTNSLAILNLSMNYVSNRLDTVFGWGDWKAGGTSTGLTIFAGGLVLPADPSTQQAPGPRMASFPIKFLTQVIGTGATRTNTLNYGINGGLKGREGDGEEVTFFSTGNLIDPLDAAGNGYASISTIHADRQVVISDSTIGSELVVNGDFDYPEGWAYTNCLYTNGLVRMSTNYYGYASLTQTANPWSPVVGTFYKISADVTGYAAPYTRVELGGVTSYFPAITGNPKTVYIIAKTTQGMRISISDGIGGTNQIDNITAVPHEGSAVYMSPTEVLVRNNNRTFFRVDQNGVQVGEASFHQDLAGNIWQDGTNTAGLGILSAEEFTLPAGVRTVSGSEESAYLSEVEAVAADVAALGTSSLTRVDAAASYAPTGALAAVVADVAALGTSSLTRVDAAATYAPTGALAAVVADVAALGTSSLTRVDAAASYATTGALGTVAADLAALEASALTRVDAAASYATTGALADAVADVAALGTSALTRVDAAASYATTGALGTVAADLVTQGTSALTRVDAVATYATTGALATVAADLVAQGTSALTRADAAATYATTGALADAQADIAVLETGAITRADAAATYATTGALADANADISVLETGALTRADAAATYATTGALAVAQSDIAVLQTGALTRVGAAAAYATTSALADAQADIAVLETGALTRADAAATYATTGALADANADISVLETGALTRADAAAAYATTGALASAQADIAVLETGALTRVDAAAAYATTGALAVAQADIAVLETGALTRVGAAAAYATTGALASARADIAVLETGALTRVDAAAAYATTGALADAQANITVLGTGALTRVDAATIYAPTGDVAAADAAMSALIVSANVLISNLWYAVSNTVDAARLGGSLPTAFYYLADFQAEMTNRMRRVSDVVTSNTAPGDITWMELVPIGGGTNELRLWGPHALGTNTPGWTTFRSVP
jgi:hypothetical protein